MKLVIASALLMVIAIFTVGLADPNDGADATREFHEQFGEAALTTKAYQTYLPDTVRVYTANST